MSSSHHLRAPSTSTHDQNGYDRHQNDDAESEDFRDIHAVTPPLPPPPGRARSWEIGSQRTRSMSMSSESGSSENFTTISNEFNALVLAGSAIGTNTNSSHHNNTPEIDMNNEGLHGNGTGTTLLAMIGEDEGVPEEEDDVHRRDTNPLAIVPDTNPMGPGPGTRRAGGVGVGGEVSVQRVKEEEVEAKISAWQNAKVSKINNRFKREDAVINGWESEQVQKATSWMKKIERKLEEKRARAFEKMQNKVAKAHRKAEERRATAEGKRGTKVARVLEVANLMRAVGRPPVKRSFF